MTQEKEILLKDLCARLPYGVKISIPDLLISSIKNIEVLNEIFKGDDGLYRVNDSGILIEYVKPYLRPMSSMTEEQQKEANIFDDMDIDILKENLERNHRNKTNIPTATYNYIDWLNENHFDYRGLIEKGLAVEAPEGMYNF